MRFTREAVSLTNQFKDGQDLSWSKAVFFEPDERLIHEFKLGAKMSLDSGVVVVTNNRILVIQNQGKAIRNYKLLAETHLEHVSGISEERNNEQENHCQDNRIPNWKILVL